ncbi:MAG TPA: anti-sigma factor [Albitalea sp.]|nr:anti-sigma factor [Albitalea sp.]
MNYLLPERLDRLAREYVLGTLTGRARRRFERLLKQAPVALLAVGAWQERFSVLAAGVPPMQPRDEVWRGLEQRLFKTAAAAKPARAGPLQWLWNLLSGRGLAGALAGVLLCVVVLRQQPGLVGLETPSEALPASYVGLLLDAAGKPTLLANSRRHGHRLTIKVLQPVVVPAGKVAQLWALPANGAPFAVAALPPLPGPRESVTLPLPDSSEKLFATVPRLMITFESAPAKPGDTPSGEPVLSGHCVKLW